jgi:hypothetical protein
MPFIKLQFKPGVNRDQTNYTNEGGWFSCDKIRFRSGYPQKIGGWLKYTTETLIGVCRQMLGWLTTFEDNFLALGTNAKVYIEAGGNLYDITPIRATFTTPSTNNCVQTFSGLTTVQINLTAHGASDGSYVTFSGIVGPVGGIPASSLNKEFAITYINPNAFSITVDTPALSSVAAGGGVNITAAFQLNVGNPGGTYGYGWGTGTWSRLTWGSGTTTPVKLPQTDWIFAYFDNDLLMNIREGTKGPIYLWKRGILTDPAIALAVRASLLSAESGASDVPDEVGQILVAQNNKHMLAFGATAYGSSDFDPLLIRWSDQDNYLNWTPTATNSAGFLRVSRGSYIVQAITTRQEVLVLTDSTVSSLQFTGTTDVFSIQELGDNISIASARAAATANNVVYWMGIDKFYVYSGRVETLPCSLRNHVFQNINFDQLAQVVSGTNEGWQEIWWFYPTADSNVNNAYIIFNYVEQIWYYGTIERTAWLDSPLRQYPQAIGGTTIYNHEQGTNDDILPMDAYIASSDFDIGEGEQFMIMRRMIPDVNFTGSTAATPRVYFSILPRNFPGNNYQNDPFDTQGVLETATDVYTEQVFIRARARQLALKIRSTEINVQWQLGSPRIDARADGKR